MPAGVWGLVRPQLCCKMLRGCCLACQAWLDIISHAPSRLRIDTGSGLMQDAAGLPPSGQGARHRFRLASFFMLRGTLTHMKEYNA